MSSLPVLQSRRAGRLALIGALIVVFGWGLLVADLVLGDALLKEGGLVVTLALKGDIVVVSQTLVLTGFGIAVLGALRDGFGALNRFFEAVLERAASPRVKPLKDEPEVEDAVVVSSRPSDPQPAPSTPTKASASSGSGKSTQAASRSRNYVILKDGSVEVETLLGTRVFATLDEARDFIR